MFTSGTLLTDAVAGAFEFLTDKFYGTITTGPARKEFTLNDIALTSGRLPFTTTLGRLTDLSTLLAGSAGVTVLSDSAKFIVGAGSDASFYYGGTNGYIKTDEVAASDLHITTGAAKTIVLDTPVYEELTAGVSWFDDPPIYAPTYEKFQDDGGTSTGVYTNFFSNSVLQSVFFRIELPRSWNGTDIIPHVHWCRTDIGNEGIVSWKIEYTLCANGYHTNDTLIIQEDFPDPNETDAGHNYTTTFSSIDISPFETEIGLILIGRLYRDIGGGVDTYNQKAGFLSLDFTYQRDTIGSRTATTK
jgi:hypothetical protein